MKLDELKVGDTVITDGGFTCMKASPRKVHEDNEGLYIRCRDGRHYLDGQEDEDGELVGLSRA